MSASTPSIALGGYDATFIAESDVRQYMGVKKGSDERHVMPLASTDTAGTVIIGVAQADADSGESVKVRLFGPSLVRASGGISQNDLCECVYNATEDKNGNMKKLTALAQDGSMIACRALEDAADLEYFKALILCMPRLAIS